MRIQIPASTANIGPGFDCLAMALTLYVEADVAPAPELAVHYDSGHPVPDQLITTAFRHLFRTLDRPQVPAAFSVTTGVPLGKGLGSSAAAIVLGLLAANELAGRPLSYDELLSLALDLEGHGDNVAASLFGGLTATVSDPCRAVHLPPPSVDVIVAVPRTKATCTSTQRAQLPPSISREDAIFNLQRLAVLCLSLAQGKLPPWPDAGMDRLHQPHRLGAADRRLMAAALSCGASMATLSGSGPSLAFWLAEGQAPAFLDAFRAAMGPGDDVELLSLKPDTLGAQVTP